MRVIRGWKAYAFSIVLGLLVLAIWNTELWHTSDQTSSVSPQDVTDEDDPTEQIRKRYRLRPMLGTEQGTRANELPEGIYGYTACGPAMDSDPSPVLSRRSVAGGVNIFEVHKRHDGTTYLVGYASREHADKFEAGVKSLALSVFADPSEEAFTVAEIPLSRMKACETHPFRKTFRLDVQLQ